MSTDAYIFAGSLHGLMMHTIDPELPHAEYLFHETPWLNIDLMGEMRTRQILVTVLYTPWKLVSQVLIETASQSNIQELHATTNAKRRNVFQERPGDQEQLECIELGIPLISERMTFLSITGGLYINTSRKQQTIQAWQQRIQRTEIIE